MNKIEELLKRQSDLDDEIQEMLEEMFPKGAQVFVVLNCRQKNPSAAKVIGCSGRGYVRVCLDKKTARKPYGLVKDIFWSDVE